MKEVLSSIIIYLKRKAATQNPAAQHATPLNKGVLRCGVAPVFATVAQQTQQSVADK